MKKKRKEIPLIFTGKICPYCGDETQLLSDEEVYGQSYGGKCWVCWPCAAWVGCHKGTDKALGRLANKELRDAKQRAHAYFDILWRAKMKKGYSKTKARRLAYTWLSEELKIPFHLTHIGMFNLNECKRVVELCRPYLKQSK